MFQDSPKNTTYPAVQARYWCTKSQTRRQIVWFQIHCKHSSHWCWINSRKTLWGFQRKKKKNQSYQKKKFVYPPRTRAWGLPGDPPEPWEPAASMPSISAHAAGVSGPAIYCQRASPRSCVSYSIAQTQGLHQGLVSYCCNKCCPSIRTPKSPASCCYLNCNGNAL